MTAFCVPKTVDLFNINDYTEQEIILFIAYSLMKQNKRAAESVGDIEIIERCRFRTSDGSKCAVGFCIPDDRYREEFEINSAVSVFTIVYRINISYSRLKILEKFQKLHDQLKPDKWESSILESFSRYFRGITELKAAIDAGIAARAA